MAMEPELSVEGEVVKVDPEAYFEVYLLVDLDDLAPSVRQ